MNTEQIPNSVIKESLTTENTTFDLEWAKIGAALIGKDDKVLFLAQGTHRSGCVYVYPANPVNGPSVRRITLRNPSFLHMATRAECDAAGVDYIEPPVSESAIVDRVAMWLYDESYASLSAHEKLSIIAHYPPIRKAGKEIGDYIVPVSAEEIINDLVELAREWTMQFVEVDSAPMNIKDYIIREYAAMKG